MCVFMVAEHGERSDKLRWHEAECEADVSDEGMEGVSSSEDIKGPGEGLELCERVMIGMMSFDDRSKCTEKTSEIGLASRENMWFDDD